MGVTVLSTGYANSWKLRMGASPAGTLQPCVDSVKFGDVATCAVSPEGIAGIAWNEQYTGAAVDRADTRAPGARARARPTTHTRNEKWGRGCTGTEAYLHDLAVVGDVHERHVRAAAAARVERAVHR